MSRLVRMADGQPVRAGIVVCVYGMVELESEFLSLHTFVIPLLIIIVSLPRFVATLRGHVGAVYRLTWSADSRLLVSGSKDSTLKIWDLKTYKIKTDLPGHTDEVYCVDFVADKIVSGGRDKVVKM